jgi:short subunit dehydrogenase-like uncharacterized protein
VREEVVTSDSLLLYGATGYTGKLITHRLLGLGLRPILCARNPAKLAAVAEPLGLSHRVARLDEPESLDAVLRDVAVVIHAAGPFSETAQPMAEACLRAGVHYLDISAEVHVIEALARRDAEARARKIMLMPAVGFDVVPSDCLAAHVARRLPGARQLFIGLTGLGLLTRASLKTLIEAWGGGVVRRDGALTAVPLGSLRRRFDYGSGPRPSLNVNWGDLATAYYTTGIPDIETYCESNPMLEAVVTASRYFGWALGSAPYQFWLKAGADLIPEGPTAAQRGAVEMVIVAEAVKDSRCARARLRTPEAYTFTAVTSAAIAERVLRGDIEAGFQTPARVYGPDFVLSFPGVSREDLD